MSEPPDPGPTAGRLVVRRFEKGDRGAFLSLYERACGRPRMPEWFAWRYEHNPYLSHVPVFLVEVDGRLVAGQAFDAFRMWTPEGSVIGIRPSGVLVDPEYGDERSVERLSDVCARFYVGDRPQFCFEFRDGTSRVWTPPFEYRTAGTVPTYYRVQNPSTFLDGRRDAPSHRLIERLSDWYLDVRLRSAAVDDDLTVGRYTELPISILSSLYREAVPKAVHVERDPTFYRWRFSDPERPATTYVAFDDDDPVAAVVTYVDVGDDVRRVRLADFVPMCETPGRDAALRVLLAAIIEEFADADLLAATGTAFPAGPLRAFGFHSDTRRPLSAVTSAATLAAAPLGTGDGGNAREGGEDRDRNEDGGGAGSENGDGDARGDDRWTLSGLRLDDGRDWRLTDAECDGP